VSLGGVVTGKSKKLRKKKKLSPPPKEKSQKRKKRTNPKQITLTVDSQFQPDFTPGLAGIALESLQQGHHFFLAVLLCHANGIRLVDIPWFPEIYLPSGCNPPLIDI